MYKILAFFLLSTLACSVDAGSTLDAGMPLASDGAVADGAVSTVDSGSTNDRVIAPHFRVGAAVLAQAFFFDRELNVTCYPRKTTKGLRCLPVGIGLTAYVDAGCTSRGGLGPSCQMTAYGTVADMPDNACDQGAYRTFTVRKLTQTSYYTRSGVACVALPIPASLSLYTADTEVDPTTFAEVVEVR